MATDRRSKECKVVQFAITKFCCIVQVFDWDRETNVEQETKPQRVKRTQ